MPNTERDKYTYDLDSNSTTLGKENLNYLGRGCRVINWNVETSNFNDETGSYQTKCNVRFVNVKIENSLISNSIKSITSITADTVEANTMKADTFEGNLKGSVSPDYVYDKYFDGKVREEDKDKQDFKFVTIDETFDFVEKHRHLPTIIGREEFKKEGGKLDIVKIIHQLWETIEIQSLYIKELNDRIKKLEN